MTAPLSVPPPPRPSLHLCLEDTHFQFLHYSPLRSGYNYNFTVDWGDGSSTSTVTAHDDSDRIHTYVNAGEYTVTISGLVEAWYFNNTGPSMLMLRQVTNLGDVGWKNLEGAFRVAAISQPWREVMSLRSRICRRCLLEPPQPLPIPVGGIHLT